MLIFRVYFLLCLVELLEKAFLAQATVAFILCLQILQLQDVLPTEIQLISIFISVSV